MADILTSKIQVPSLPDDTLILKDAEARNDLSTALATATGNPLNFSTRSAQKAKETVISLEPIQDLHGYDYPWPAGGGKNKLPMTVDGIKAANKSGIWTDNNYNQNEGLIYTILTDDYGNVIGININGTSTSVSYFYLAKNYTMKADSYILNGGISANIRVYDDGSISSEGSDASFTLNSDTTKDWLIRVANGVTTNNVKILPMIRLATETDATFAPYSNYCPIDGRTETSLVGTNGKESTDPDYIESNNLTLQFGEKVYGSTVDLESGTVTVDRAVLLADENTNWTEGSINNNWRWRFYLPDASSSYTQDITKKISSILPYNTDVYLDSTNSVGFIVNGTSLFARAGNEYDTVDKIKALFAGQTFVYPLATPRTITITPNEISLLSGVNNISTDGDSISLTYRNGKVATLGDLEDAANNLQEQIDQNETMEDETTQLLYKLGVNNGLLFMEEV